MNKSSDINKPFYLAVRGILFDDQRRVLLMRRAPNSQYEAGFWEFPGGKVDPGENFSDALKREFKEETGFEISLEKVLGSGEWERPEYRIAYLFMLVKRVSGELRISPEHDQFFWMDKEQLAHAKISPQLTEIRDKIIHLLDNIPR